MKNKDYRFEGVIIPGKKGFWDIHIKNGKFETISKSSKSKGGILSPRFADIHVHLDKTGTAKRIGQRAGTLFDAIELMNMDKELWTQDDIYNRVMLCQQRVTPDDVLNFYKLLNLSLNSTLY